MPSRNSLSSQQLDAVPPAPHHLGVRQTAVRFARRRLALPRSTLHLPLLLAVACSAGDGAGAPIDAHRTARDLQAVAATLDAPVLAALLRARPAIDAALGNRTLGLTVDLLLPIVAAAPGGATPAARARLASSARRQPSLDLPLPAATGPFEGVTFALAPDGRRYVPTSRRGAPVTGARFLLHGRGAARPELGWVDVVREPGEDGGLFLSVHGDGATWLECRLARVPQAGGAALELAGSALGEAGRLDFAVTVERSDATRGTERVTRRLALEARDLALSWTVTGDPVAGSRALDLALGGRGGTLLVAGHSTAGGGRYDAMANGEPWALVELREAGASMRRPDGTGLDAAERAVLLGLLESIGGAVVSPRPSTAAS
ncbi:MAG: hypothetical protein MUC69_06730 [Gemmatimonadales bacterium]|jgi:hypothetical protein|nr:hypothetical protein [Gemmatimonadales bacterium]